MPSGLAALLSCSCSDPDAVPDSSADPRRRVSAPYTLRSRRSSRSPSQPGSRASRTTTPPSAARPATTPSTGDSPVSPSAATPRPVLSPTEPLAPSDLRMSAPTTHTGTGDSTHTPHPPKNQPHALPTLHQADIEGANSSISNAHACGSPATSLRHGRSTPSTSAGQSVTSHQSSQHHNMATAVSGQQQAHPPQGVPHPGAPPMTHFVEVPAMPGQPQLPKGCPPPPPTLLLCGCNMSSQVAGSASTSPAAVSGADEPVSKTGGKLAPQMPLTEIFTRGDSTDKFGFSKFFSKAKKEPYLPPVRAYMAKAPQSAQASSSSKRQVSVKLELTPDDRKAQYHHPVSGEPIAEVVALHSKFDPENRLVGVAVGQALERYVAKHEALYTKAHHIRGTQAQQQQSQNSGTTTVYCPQTTLATIYQTSHPPPTPIPEYIQRLAQNGHASPSVLIGALILVDRFVSLMNHTTTKVDILSAFTAPPPEPSPDVLRKRVMQETGQDPLPMLASDEDPHGNTSFSSSASSNVSLSTGASPGGAGDPSEEEEVQQFIKEQQDIEQWMADNAFVKCDGCGGAVSSPELAKVKKPRWSTATCGSTSTMVAGKAKPLSYDQSRMQLRTIEHDSADLGSAQLLSTIVQARQEEVQAQAAEARRAGKVPEAEAFTQNDVVDNYVFVTRCVIYKLFLAAFRIAAKTMDLRTLGGKHVATIGGVTLDVLNGLEAQMLLDMNFDVSVSPFEFAEYSRRCWPQFVPTASARVAIKHGICPLVSSKVQFEAAQRLAVGSFARRALEETALLMKKKTQVLREARRVVRERRAERHQQRVAEMQLQHSHGHSTSTDAAPGTTGAQANPVSPESGAPPPTLAVVTPTGRGSGSAAGAEHGGPSSPGLGSSFNNGRHQPNLVQLFATSGGTGTGPLGSFSGMPSPSGRGGATTGSSVHLPTIPQPQSPGGAGALQQPSSQYGSSQSLSTSSQSFQPGMSVAGMSAAGMSVFSTSALPTAAVAQYACAPQSDVALQPGQTQGAQGAGFLHPPAQGQVHNLAAFGGMSPGASACQAPRAPNALFMSTSNVSAIAPAAMSPGTSMSQWQLQYHNGGQSPQGLRGAVPGANSSLANPPSPASSANSQGALPVLTAQKPSLGRVAPTMTKLDDPAPPSPCP